MNDAMVRVSFKDGYAFMDIADQVAVRLYPGEGQGACPSAPGGRQQG